MNDTSIPRPAWVVHPSAAARALADWGFLARPDLPDRAGPAFLLVALRDRPTLRHYDPEEVRYWASVDGRGTPRVLDRRVRLPFEERFSWGQITLVDRLGVRNDYLTFGGRLRAEKVDGASIAVFESPAPILRRGGHSQGWDRGGEEVAAFFGRLLLAVDIVPGFERAVAAAQPDAIYAAFLRESVRRYRGSEHLRQADPELWSLLRGEAVRLERDRADAWAAGLALLGPLHRDVRPV